MPVTDMDWLKTTTGRNLLRKESDRVRLALEGIFGDQFLQIGVWGGNEFRQFARTKRTAIFCNSVSHGVDGVADLVMKENNLGIANDSIDIALLPHVLEETEDPHGVLRELDRVLRSDGHVVILGFNPVSLWGLRHLVSRRQFPPGIRRTISEHRLRDWLRLLNFSVDHSSFHYFHASMFRPYAGRRRLVGAAEDNKAGPRPITDPARRSNRLFRALRLSFSAASDAWHRHAPFASCYMLVARKSLYTMTPIKPVWKTGRRLVGGLVNPTTRNVA